MTGICNYFSFCSIYDPHSDGRSACNYCIYSRFSNRRKRKDCFISSKISMCCVCKFRFDVDYCIDCDPYDASLCWFRYDGGDSNG